MELFQAASVASKMTATKFYFFIFNLENVVERLDNSLKPCNFMFEKGKKVNMGKYKESDRLFATHSITIPR